MHKDTKKNKWPQVVRFWYAKPDGGQEYLVECRVECEPPVDHEIELTSAPCLYTVDVIRAETNEGIEVSADEFLTCWGDLEHHAVQWADHEETAARFFSDELEAAKAYEKEMARQLADAEYHLEQAEWRFKDATRRHKDAKTQLEHVRKIQSVPAV